VARKVVRGSGVRGRVDDDAGGAVASEAVLGVQPSSSVSEVRGSQSLLDGRMR
jgi:hypothetical protein